jgi:hypothetical protein
MPDREAELTARPHSHLVQLYDADIGALFANVGAYASEGLHAGDGVIMIATAEHRSAFVAAIAALGADPDAAVDAGRLVLLDAEATLARFMVDGQPDWALFEATIAPALRTLRERAGGTHVRAYGEMVGILWQAGQYAAAIQLETFWNRLIEAGGFDLFCAYPIDVFGDEFRSADVDGVLCTHTHLVPTDGGQLQRALDRALDDVLGRSAQDVRRLVETQQRPSWAAIPSGEAAILWLRSHLPAYADEIVARARRHYLTAA